MIYHIKSTILISLSLPRLQCRVNWPWKKEQMKVAYFTYFTVINKALLSVSVCGLSSFKIDIVKPDDRIWDVKVLLNPGAGSIFSLFSVNVKKNSSTNDTIYRLPLSFSHEHSWLPLHSMQIHQLRKKMEQRKKKICCVVAFYDQVRRIKCVTYYKINYVHSIKKSLGKWEIFIK